MSTAKAVDQSMWEGFTLPEDLGCDCHKGEPHHSQYYRPLPIVKSAREYPAGSNSFLETNFSRAFTLQIDQGGSVCTFSICYASSSTTSFVTSIFPVKRLFQAKMLTDSKNQRNHRISSVLGSQSVLPKLLPMQASEWEKLQEGSPMQVLYGKLQYEDFPSLVVYIKTIGIEKTDLTPQDVDHQELHVTSDPFLRFCLFKLSMPADGPLEAVLKFSRSQVTRSNRVGLFAAYKTMSGGLTYRYSELPYDLSLSSHHMNLDYLENGSRLVELGVYCERQVDIIQPLQLLSIERLVVSPAPKLRGRNFAIHNIHTTQRGKGLDVERRLAWQWRGAHETWPTWLPWSKTTGPFSHFAVSIQGREVGKAYCLEFPVRTDDIGPSGTVSGDIKVQVRGLFFGGEEIISSLVTIRIGDTDPEQKN